MKNLLKEQLSTKKNFDCKTFLYESPFTLSGKPSDDITEQCKRKFIITTSSVFPHVVNRLIIEHKEKFELSPIENSIEINYGKVKSLQSCVQFNFDSKAVSLLLHGILLAQVNSGPLPVARTFLSTENVSKYDEVHVNRLREVFIEFVQILAEAVGRNKQEIGPNELTVQNQIEIAYFRFKDEVSKLTNANLENVVETFTEPEDILAQLEQEQAMSNSEQSGTPSVKRTQRVTVS